MTGRTRPRLTSRAPVLPRIQPATRGRPDRSICLTGGDTGVLIAVSSVLSSQGYEVHRFATAAELLQAAHSVSPGVVVVCCENGTDNCPDEPIALVYRLPAFRVILVAAFPRASFVVAAIRAGAVTVLDTPLDSDSLISAVREGIGQLDCATQFDEAHPGLPPVLPRGQCYLDRLSARERDVMQLVFAGATNKSIGIQLGISIKTVEKHRGRAMQKLEVDSVAGLIRLMDREQGVKAMPTGSEGAA